MKNKIFVLFVFAMLAQMGIAQQAQASGCGGTRWTTTSNTFSKSTLTSSNWALTLVSANTWKGRATLILESAEKENIQLQTSIDLQTTAIGEVYAAVTGFKSEIPVYIQEMWSVLDGYDDCGSLEEGSTMVERRHVLQILMSNGSVVQLKGTFESQTFNPDGTPVGH